VLEVSTSGYYGWLKRERSAHAKRDVELAEKIKQSHERSRGTYGRPRVHADLKEAGERVGQKRVGRLMREQGLRGASRRRRFSTTQRDEDARPAPDLVDRNFEVEGPDRLWVADITYLPTLAGFLYLAVVVDAWSRRVVGWAMASYLKTQLVIDALDMALEWRRPGSVIFHSDHGSQYTSFEFGRRCREAGVRPSMGSVGDCFDNALCESFFATLECELLERQGLLSPDETRLAVFEFIEGWYNLHRRHSSLGMLSPAAFERKQVAA
jgi:putative transposase